MGEILRVENLSYSYVDGSNKRIILDNINCSFEKGKFYTILGASGSGKTTLLSLIGGLEKVQTGSILFENKDILNIGLAQYRKNDVAIVFQQYNLITYLTARENVELALEYRPNRKKLAYAILNQLGIVRTKADRIINKLSGGEQQRVAIARAMASNVDLIIADEPTGNLDSETETEIIRILGSLAHEYDKTVIVVTHSKEVSLMSDETYLLKDRKLNKVEN